MIVKVETMDNVDEVECDSFHLTDNRLVLKDGQGRTVYVVNVDRWISFEVDYEDSNVGNP